MRAKVSRGVLWAALRTTPGVVTAISALSLFILLVKMLWLNDLPPAFPYATDLGLLVENVAAATIAAFLFFLISFQVPQVMEQRRLGPTIVRLSSNVVDSLAFCLRMIRNAAAPEFSGTELVLGKVTMDSLKTWFAKLAPTDASPLAADVMASQRFSWIQVLMHQEAQCRSGIERVWRYSRFIEPELASLLEAIDSSPFSDNMRLWRELTSRPKLQLNISNLLTWSETFFDWVQKSVALASYLERYRARYGITEPHSHQGEE